MTAQERIDHVAEARRLLSAEANGGTQAERALLLQGAMQAAQVHATLALVEQEWIANLIAFRNSAIPLDDKYLLEAKIRKALGL